MVNWLTEEIIKEIPPTWTILDLGCGPSSPILDLPNPKLCADINLPYLDKMRAVPTIRMDLANTDHLNMFQNRSFEAVILFDVIEHLEKPQAFTLIQNAERIARKIIIIFTPEEFLEQENHNKGDNEYQTHRCGFKKEELEMLGYACKLFPGDAMHSRNYKAIFAVKNLNQ